MPLKLEHIFVNCKKVDLEKSGINGKPIQCNEKYVEAYVVLIRLKFCYTLNKVFKQ